jgi:DNA-directed RNA polymerase specialized sigma24 family protein
MLVRMHFVEGLAIPEVARSLRMTDNATHVMKSRLRSKLRLALGDLHGDE